MNPRKPRPPVAEQGTSRAYREGRLQDPEALAPNPAAPLATWRVALGWASVVVGGFAYGLLLALDAFKGGAWSWLLLVGAACTLCGGLLLRTNSRGFWWRSAPRYRAGYVAAVFAALGWIALVVLASSTWHLRGAVPITVTVAVTLGLWILLFVISWRGHRSAGLKPTVSDDG